MIASASIPRDINEPTIDNARIIFGATKPPRKTNPVYGQVRYADRVALAHWHTHHDSTVVPPSGYSHSP
ncbi:unnamed protein product [Lasius platythorax]|uniref:Uncharacterized protein n=1 Tax=Lasius platythorax TaxID=488582 RepID=A0AAV2NYA1_9HYME